MNYKNLLKIFIKLVVLIFGIIFILKNIEINSLIENFSNINIYYFIFAIIIMLGSKIFIAYRQQYSLKVQGININFKDSLLLYYISFFFNFFIPGSQGGDVVRGMIIGKQNKSYKKSYYAILLERLFGLISIIFFALIPCILYYEKILSNLIDLKLFTILLIVGIILFCVIVYIFQNKFIIFINFIKENKIIFIKIFLLSLIFQLANIFFSYFIFKSFNIEISLYYVFVFQSIIMLLLMVPISINGIGVREVLFVMLYTGILGINKELIISSSILSFLLLTFESIIGGFVYLFYKGKNI